MCSLTIECVLLLKNGFSYYTKFSPTMCSGSKECVLTMCSGSKECVLTMCSGSKECVLRMCSGSK